ncbi:MAG: hypothetical protein EBX52_11455 [Proteobacteria bacterium]|nr:hypothetical protein [Pseudomonadota bacterium]
MKISSFAPVFAVLVLVSACSHNTREIRAEARSEPVTTAPGSLKDRMIELIQQDKNITPDQRESLLALAEKVTKEQAANQLLLTQSKSLLLKELLSPNYDVKKANSIARTIRKLYDKQLHVTINAMQEAKTILNRLQNREVFMNRLMENGGRW